MTSKITSDAEFNSLINSQKPSVVLFSADWADQCKQVENVLGDLANLLKENLQFATIIAEDFPEISMKYKVDAVPTVIFYKSGQAIDHVAGVDIAALSEKCNKLSANSSGDSSMPLESRLKLLINKAPIMIFMKGDRYAPRCGFSKQVIAIIKETGLPFETFDILSDEDVRQGLKKYSDWPTYPQVYVNGELLGGLDIIKELKENGELNTTLKG